MAKLALINPNTSAGMTAALEQSARAVLPPDCELLVTNPATGVASIEGFADGVQASHALLGLAREIRADGWLVACADDTGVDALRELCTGPVLGIGQAAMQAATLLSLRYSILTPMERSVTILEQNARRYGLDVNLRGVHALNLPVLALEESYALIEARAREVLAQDRCECLVLGCAGFTLFRQPLEQALGVPVIDGVQVGLQWLAGLTRLGLATSKRCSYAFPETK